jgi:flagellar biosynthesis anti-sigma factor FlgM
MKIEDPRSVSSSPILRQTPPANSGPAKPDVRGPEAGAGPAGQPAARVELSARSREMHQALDAANAAPDVRADKVAETKQRIAQGTYTVKADVVARGILDKRA